MQTRSTYYPTPPPPAPRSRATRAIGTNTISTSTTTTTTSTNFRRTIHPTTPTTSSTTVRRRHLQVSFVEPAKPQKRASREKIKGVVANRNSSTLRRVVKGVVEVGKKLDTQNRIVKKPRSARKGKGSGKNIISD